MSAKVLRKMYSREASRSRGFPIEPPLLDPVGHRVKPEVHRAHVQRAHLWFQLHRAASALLERHPLIAAGGDVDDRVGALFDLAAGSA